MIAFDEAIGRLTEVARPIGRESIPLREAAGRVLAAPVVAMVDSPPADNSSMDGYAVRDADLPGALRLIGESLAGRGFGGILEAGTCVRIFTGAPVPAGADRVVIQEVAVRDGDQVSFAEPPGDPRHIRAQGSDFRTGETLLEPGRRLDPRALVTAAAADVAEVETWRSPGLLLLATGDELAPSGEARRRPGTVPESISAGVSALAETWG
ncbi:MAG: molybdopterin molybdotransferase, partial [Sphingomonadales bacterium]|nr:molybdopterin molybdotransferase [Sphingomonadales bacterium]